MMSSAPNDLRDFVVACFYGSVGGQELEKRRLKKPAPWRVKIPVRPTAAANPTLQAVLYYELAGYHLCEAVYCRIYSK